MASFLSSLRTTILTTGFAWATAVSVAFATFDMVTSPLSASPTGSCRPAKTILDTARGNPVAIPWHHGQDGAGHHTTRQAADHRAATDERMLEKFRTQGLLPRPGGRPTPESTQRGSTPAETDGWLRHTNADAGAREPPARKICAAMVRSVAGRHAAAAWTANSSAATDSASVMAPEHISATDSLRGAVRVVIQASVASPRRPPTLPGANAQWPSVPESSRAMVIRNRTDHLLVALELQHPRIPEASTAASTRYLPLSSLQTARMLADAESLIITTRRIVRLSTLVRRSKLPAAAVPATEPVQRG